MPEVVGVEKEGDAAPRLVTCVRALLGPHSAREEQLGSSAPGSATTTQCFYEFEPKSFGRERNRFVVVVHDDCSQAQALFHWRLRGWVEATPHAASSSLAPGRRFRVEDRFVLLEPRMHGGRAKQITDPALVAAANSFRNEFFFLRVAGCPVVPEHDHHQVGKLVQLFRGQRCMISAPLEQEPVQIGALYQQRRPFIRPTNGIRLRGCAKSLRVLTGLCRQIGERGDHEQTR